MGVPGSPAPDNIGAQGSAETIYSNDALDPVDEEGLSEAEEMDEAAAEREAPASAVTESSEAVALNPQPVTVDSPVDHAHVEQAASLKSEATPAAHTEPLVSMPPAIHETPAAVAPPAAPATPTSSVAPVEPAPSPAAPDHADHDPQ
jgi:hypothetical protein